MKAYWVMVGNEGHPLCQYDKNGKDWVSAFTDQSKKVDSAEPPWKWKRWTIRRIMSHIVVHGHGQVIGVVVDDNRRIRA